MHLHVAARAAYRLRLQSAVAVWACGGWHSFRALLSRSVRIRRHSHTHTRPQQPRHGHHHHNNNLPGNSHASARPLCLHLSHGGRSSWMHFCLADRQDTQATGLRMLTMLRAWLSNEDDKRHLDCPLPESHHGL